MHEAKQIGSPMASSTNLSAFDVEDFSDTTLFRITVEALQYLLVTRTYIAFTVNKLSKFIHKLELSHCQAAKHLLHYLKQTINYSFYIWNSTNSILQAFLDDDWVGFLIENQLEYTVFS